jgi:hypothetical protein
MMNINRILLITKLGRNIYSHYENSSLIYNDICKNQYYEKYFRKVNAIQCDPCYIDNVSELCFYYSSNNDYKRILAGVDVYLPSSITLVTEVM